VDYHRSKVDEWEVKSCTSWEVLLEEFLKPMGLSQNRLSLEIGVHPWCIKGIVLGKRRITAVTALRLARYFGTSPQFWMGLQNVYDLDVAANALGIGWRSRSDLWRYLDNLI
jgi:antitoxin HigA-1